MYPYTYVPWKVFIKSCCENVKHVPKLCKSGRSSCYSTLLKRFFILFFILFTAHRGLGFYYIIYTVLQWDLPPLRPPLWGGHPRQRFEPGTGDLEDGTAHLEKYYKYCIKWCFLKLFSSQKLRFFFGLRGRFPSLPWDFLHYSLCSCSASVYHCGRCWIRTQDLCPGFEPGTNEPPHLKTTPTNHGKIWVPKVMYSM